MKDILEGVKEVILELSSGMKESCQVVFQESSELYKDLNVKLMGSYDEIEEHEKSKETAIETEK